MAAKEGPPRDLAFYESQIDRFLGGPVKLTLTIPRGTKPGLGMTFAKLLAPGEEVAYLPGLFEEKNLPSAKKLGMRDSIELQAAISVYTRTLNATSHGWGAAYKGTSSVTAGAGTRAPRNPPPPALHANYLRSPQLSAAALRRAEPTGFCSRVTSFSPSMAWPRRRGGSLRATSRRRRLEGTTRSSWTSSGPRPSSAGRASSSRSCTRTTISPTEAAGAEVEKLYHRRPPPSSRKGTLPARSTGSRITSRTTSRQEKSSRSCSPVEGGSSRPDSPTPML